MLVMCQNFLLLFLAEYYIACMYHILFVHSSVNGQLSCFPLAIVNNGAVNVDV